MFKTVGVLLLASVMGVRLKYEESEGPTKEDNGEADETVVMREADIEMSSKKYSGWTNPLGWTDDGTDDNLVLGREPFYGDPEEPKPSKKDGKKKKEEGKDAKKDAAAPKKEEAKKSSKAQLNAVANSLVQVFKPTEVLAQNPSSKY